jgi:L-iditol 2-dehydrogenase
MLRAELLEPGRIELRDVPVPDPGPGELLVRVEAALTCGTDIKTWQRGHPKLVTPAPFGHECAGTVAKTGAGVIGFREGDPIAFVPTAPCEECRACLRGRENLCPLAVGRIALGAFAEYIVLPVHLVLQNVFHRPASLTAEQAAALEPLACVVHGASRVDFSRAESVVLLGDGPIALLFARLARLQCDADLLVAGRHETRLRAARAWGARTTILRDEALISEVRGATDAGADIVIECVGRPETWQLAQALAAPGAEVLLYGGCAAGTRAAFDTYRLHYEEMDLKGAFHYTRADVRTALDLLERGDVDPTPLITHRRPLVELQDALALVLEREAIKVALLP